MFNTQLYMAIDSMIIFFINFAIKMNISVFKNEFDKSYMPLCMYALRILNIREEAEDVVQQTFATVWETIRNGKEIENFKSYLYRSVHNRSLTRLKAINVGQMESIENISEDVSEEDIDTSERDARLWEEIEKLPERCREIFLLSKRDGLSHKEISQKMGISVKTIENQITKAYTRLRKSLESHEGMVFFLPFL